MVVRGVSGFAQAPTGVPAPDAPSRPGVGLTADVFAVEAESEAGRTPGTRYRQLELRQTEPPLGRRRESVCGCTPDRSRRPVAPLFRRIVGSVFATRRTTRRHQPPRPVRLPLSFVGSSDHPITAATGRTDAYRTNTGRLASPTQVPRRVWV